MKKSNLSKERLKNYAVSNSAYYLKYLEKFNQQEKFYSWNWSAFLFPYAWTAHRKMWGPFSILLVFNIIIVSISYALIAMPTAGEIYLVLFGILLLAAGGYALFLTIRANSIFLANAQYNSIEEDNHTVVFNGKNYWRNTLLATIIFLIPTIMFSYGALKIHIEKIDKNNIYLISLLNEDDTDSIQHTKYLIESIADDNINSNDYQGRTAFFNSVCLDSAEILTQLTTKGAHANQSDLIQAVDCNAANSVRYLMKAGVTLTDAELLSAVCRTIYDEHLSSLKALLVKSVELGAAKCGIVTLIEAAIDLNEAQRLEYITVLLEKGGEAFREHAFKDMEILMLAVAKNDLQVTKYLLDIGVDKTDDVVFKSLNLPNSMIQLLFSYSVDPNMQIYNRPVIEHVIEASLIEKIRFLISVGARITAESYVIASDKGEKEIIQLLEKSISKQKPTFSNREIDRFYDKACASKNTSMIDFLITQGYDINARAPRGDDKRYANCDTSIFSYLLTKDVVNSTKLHQASIDGEINTIKKLLAQGVNIETRDKDGDTALLKAIRKDRIKIIKFLIETGANIEARGRDNDAALNRLAQSRNPIGVQAPEIAKLLLANGANIEAKNDHGNTVLLESTSHLAHVDLVKTLLNHGADIEAKDKYRKTSLINAATFGNTELVKLLLSKGARLDAKDMSGTSALSYAVTRGHMDVVKLLIDNGASLGHDLQIAVYNGDTTMVQYLLKKGASTHAADDQGNTPLTTSTARGHTEITQLLLNKGGVDVNQKNGRDESALMLAAMLEQFHVMELLLEKGADINILSNGKSLLHLAVEYENIPLIKFMLDNKIDSEILDNDGETALVKATELNKIKAIKVLHNHNVVNAIIRDEEKSPSIR